MRRPRSPAAEAGGRPPPPRWARRRRARAGPRPPGPAGWPAPSAAARVATRSHPAAAGVRLLAGGRPGFGRTSQLPGGPDRARWPDVVAGDVAAVLDAVRAGRAAVLHRDPRRTAESMERFAAGDGLRWLVRRTG